MLTVVSSHNTAPTKDQLTEKDTNFAWYQCSSIVMRRIRARSFCSRSSDTDTEGHDDHDSRLIFDSTFDARTELLEILSNGWDEPSCNKDIANLSTSKVASTSDVDIMMRVSTALRASDDDHRFCALKVLSSLASHDHNCKLIAASNYLVIPTTIQLLSNPPNLLQALQLLWKLSVNDQVRKIFVIKYPHLITKISELIMCDEVALKLKISAVGLARNIALCRESFRIFVKVPESYNLVSFIVHFISNQYRTVHCSESWSFRRQLLGLLWNLSVDKHVQSHVASITSSDTSFYRSLISIVRSSEHHTESIGEQQSALFSMGILRNLAANDSLQTSQDDVNQAIGNLAMHIFKRYASVTGPSDFHAEGSDCILWHTMHFVRNVSEFAPTVFALFTIHKVDMLIHTLLVFITQHQFAATTVRYIIRTAANLLRCLPGSISIASAVRKDFQQWLPLLFDFITQTTLSLSQQQTTTDNSKFSSCSSVCSNNSRDSRLESRRKPKKTVCCDLLCLLHACQPFDATLYVDTASLQGFKILHFLHNAAQFFLSQLREDAEDIESMSESASQVILLLWNYSYSSSQQALNATDEHAHHVSRTLFDDSCNRNAAASHTEGVADALYHELVIHIIRALDQYSQSTTSQPDSHDSMSGSTVSQRDVSTLLVLLHQWQVIFCFRRHWLPVSLIPSSADVLAHEPNAVEGWNTVDLLCTVTEDDADTFDRKTTSDTLGSDSASPKGSIAFGTITSTVWSRQELQAIKRLVSLSLVPHRAGDHSLETSRVQRSCLQVLHGFLMQPIRLDQLRADNVVEDILFIQRLLIQFVRGLLEEYCAFEDKDDVQAVDARSQKPHLQDIQSTTTVDAISVLVTCLRLSSSFPSTVVPAAVSSHIWLLAQQLWIFCRSHASTSHPSDHTERWTHREVETVLEQLREHQQHAELKLEAQTATSVSSSLVFVRSEVIDTPLQQLAQHIQHSLPSLRLFDHDGRVTEDNPTPAQAIVHGSVYILHQTTHLLLAGLVRRLDCLVTQAVHMVGDVATEAVAVAGALVQLMANLVLQCLTIQPGTTSPNITTSVPPVATPPIDGAPLTHQQVFELDMVLETLSLALQGLCQLLKLPLRLLRGGADAVISRGDICGEDNCTRDGVTVECMEEEEESSFIWCIESARVSLLLCDLLGVHCINHDHRPSHHPRHSIIRGRSQRRHDATENHAASDLYRLLQGSAHRHQTTACADQLRNHLQCYYDHLQHFQQTPHQEPASVSACTSHGATPCTPPCTSSSLPVEETGLKETQSQRQPLRTQLSLREPQDGDPSVYLRAMLCEHDLPLQDEPNATVFVAVDEDVMQQEVNNQGEANVDEKVLWITSPPLPPQVSPQPHSRPHRELRGRVTHTSPVTTKANHPHDPAASAHHSASTIGSVAHVNDREGHVHEHVQHLPDFTAWEDVSCLVS